MVAICLIVFILLMGVVVLLLLLDRVTWNDFDQSSIDVLDQIRKNNEQQSWKITYPAGAEPDWAKPKPPEPPYNELEQ